MDELTSQQVALVIGIREPDSSTGALALVLANATMADVRGCEVFINEVMVDIDPDFGSQFTNLPPMTLFNSFGVNATESPSLSRRSLPYSVNTYTEATPGFTSNIPWYSIVHEVGPDDSTAEGFRHLSWHKLDNYYEFTRTSTGSIATQLTLAGYPSNYPDIYSEVLENVSLNPVCVVETVTSTVITVDDARGFPKTPYYGNKLEYTDANGVIRTHTYTERSGYDATNMNKPKQFTIVANSTFTSNLTAGTKLRLTRAYNFRKAGTILTDATASPAPTTITPFLQGTRDTNSLHLADAFLCLWHPNLGRPHTFYSDSTRTWLSPTGDRAVDKKPYNSMPEHFETIHYHDASYYASLGPFALHMKTPKPPEQAVKSGGYRTVQSTTSSTIVTDAGTALSASTHIFVDGQGFTVSSDDGTTITVNETVSGVATGELVYYGGDGSVATAQSIDSLNNPHVHQGGQFDSTDASTKVMLNHFWPCGSRGGPLVSRLDGYGYVSASWDFPRDYNFDGPVWTDQDDDGSYTVSSGITKTSYDSISNPTRSIPGGYRYSLRQPYNKPQWALYGARAFREAAITSTNTSASYTHGPLVQHEAQTWTYAGGDTAQSDASYTAKYVGILERHTNFSGLLGVDKPEMQVRYADGMRMTRPFGCPVRTLRNDSTVVRDWWGDAQGMNLARLDKAVEYYLVDWWGNTRGEDIRRYPVRGFGIRPAWDAGDAYEYDRTNGRTPYLRLYNGGNPLVNLKSLVTIGTSNILSSPGKTIPRYGGRVNNTNNNSTTTLVDVFMPTHAQRVGDMGNGRGIRYPTSFNEDVLADLDEIDQTTGIVLSHHTAEPAHKGGLIRARNDVLQTGELSRGISARLGIAEDGLLKPEAVVSDRVETVSGTSVHKDAVSRSSPRIGLDTENIEGVDDNVIAINTEAHSLHTDRNVGQRVVLQGGMQTGSQTLGDYDLTSLTFAGQPQGGVMRLSHTSNFAPVGGTYLAQVRNFLSPISDQGWGTAVSNLGSNPYVTNVFSSASARTNVTDKSITFMLRPVRLLDKQHVEMFRSNLNLHSSSPQYGPTYFSATAGGKYGLYTYEVPNGRASDGYYVRGTNPDTNPPYAPSYTMNIASSDTVPASKGPKLLGTSASGFDSTKLDNEVTRIIISENTLQHFRADAPRRRTENEDGESTSRVDFTVQPRFSQALHPKGHKGDVSYNTSDHSGDAS